ncbi:MAG: bifunctional adenosylcobinamide kinase/adenosylcobinamide-phosphate guanylyltransferase [Actinomycetota bacterium]
MPLVVLLGGARSGKSSLTMRLASACGTPVTFVATAEARDTEMVDRIARHRAERPADWDVIEEPLDLLAGLDKPPDGDCVIVDCLTLWVSNLIEQGLADDEVRERAVEAADAARSRSGRTIVVGNEVGSGVVPMNELARRYRDLLGSVNAAWAARAHHSALLVAGRVVGLTDPARFIEEVDRG